MILVPYLQSWYYFVASENTPIKKDLNVEKNRQIRTLVKSSWIETSMQSESHYNYRLISLTSIVCKLIESIISEQLKNCLLNEKIIPDQQYGFMTGRSVMTNLLPCINIWSSSLYNKHQTACIYPILQLCQGI